MKDTFFKCGDKVFYIGILGDRNEGSITAVQPDCTFYADEPHYWVNCGNGGGLVKESALKPVDPLGMMAS